MIYIFSIFSIFKSFQFSRFMNNFINNRIIINFENIEFKCKMNNVKRILILRNV